MAEISSSKITQIMQLVMYSFVVASCIHSSRNNEHIKAMITCYDHNEFEESYKES